MSMTESEINSLIETKLEPLRAEIRALQQQLGMSQATIVSNTTQNPIVSSEPENSDTLEQPTIAPERADFQKFLQRGLELEQLEYTEEKLEAKPEPKKGWNPFKR